jgi:hypothetical protein
MLKKTGMPVIDNATLCTEKLIKNVDPMSSVPAKIKLKY